MSNSDSVSKSKKSDMIRPMTFCNLANFYIPSTGVVSYTTLSVNIMNPTLRYDHKQKYFCQLN